ncbi:MAG: DUF3768 domain-containing protein [Alphaproteobacteria bacterium]|nr:MAG: DUF3768 domain-containing protein [Alphaproteobacteria bacterium]
MNYETNARIRALNDELRVHGRGGRVLITQGINNESLIFAVKARAAVARDTTFSPDNDPYAEHDFGSVAVDGKQIFWKIDYYDADLHFAAEDPSNPDITQRVLTIMLAEEY